MQNLKHALANRRKGLNITIAVTPHDDNKTDLAPSSKEEMGENPSAEMGAHPIADMHEKMKEAEDPDAGMHEALMGPPMDENEKAKLHAPGGANTLHKKALLAHLMSKK